MSCVQLPAKESALFKRVLVSGGLPDLRALSLPRSRALLRLLLLPSPAALLLLLSLSPLLALPP